MTDTNAYTRINFENRQICQLVYKHYCQGSYSFKLFKFQDFLNFFHDIFKFFMTILAVTFYKVSQSFDKCFRVFLTLNSSTDTNSCAQLNVCHSCCFITSLYIVLALSFAVNNLPNKTLILRDFQGPTFTEIS